MVGIIELSEGVNLDPHGMLPGQNDSRAGLLIKSVGRLFHSLAVLGKNECL